VGKLVGISLFQFLLELADLDSFFQRSYSAGKVVKGVL
jgi:hypothetical protein